MAWPVIGEVRQIHYSKKYLALRPANQHRHCKVIAKAAKGANCLVLLKGGIQMIVPGGNLAPAFTYK